MTQPLSLQAVFRCKSPEFQAWAAAHMEPGAHPCEDTAKRYVYAICGIASRSELNTNAEAAQRYAAMVSKYRRSLAEAA